MEANYPASRVYTRQRQDHGYYRGTVYMMMQPGRLDAAE